jgi:hypothetical protein
LSDVTAHRLAAIVSTAKALESTLLPAAMSYGPPAVGVWAVIQVFRALRRRLRIRSS